MRKNILGNFYINIPLFEEERMQTSKKSIYVLFGGQESRDTL